MPITVRPLPREAEDAVRRGLGAAGRFPRRRGAAMSLTLPHPVYDAGLEALAAGRPLHEAAGHTGWRALVEEDRTVVAAAEVAGPGGAPATLNRGPFVGATVDALRGAERHDRVSAEQFELRLLRVPALAVLALWLHAHGGGDLVLPLAPAPDPLTAGTAYDARRIEGELARMAAEVLAHYRAADRPDEMGS